MGRDVVPGFAAELRRLREERGWSVYDLGRLAGTHPQSIAKIEREERSPSLRVALAIAQAIGVSIDEMCGAKGRVKPRGRGRPKTPASD